MMSSHHPKLLWYQVHPVTILPTRQLIVESSQVAYNFYYILLPCERDTTSALSFFYYTRIDYNSTNRELILLDLTPTALVITGTSHTILNSLKTVL